MDSSTICIDAGLPVRLVVDHPLSERVSALFESWREAGATLVAPRLL